MAQKTKKYLIETSVARAILGNSTIIHNKYVASETEDGSLWSSVYIRMEYIRRFVCDTIRVAITIHQFTDVRDALIYLEQDFKPRNVKGTLAAIAIYLGERGAMQNSRLAAEELGSIAVKMITKFDEMFPKRISNSSGCQIGSMTPRINFDRLLADLKSFYDVFKTPVTNCEVNGFLQLGKAHSRVQPLIADNKACKLDAVKHIASFKENGKWVTCRECGTIGDGIIALEQSASWILVLDKSFNELCRVLGRNHKQLKSVSSFKDQKIL